MLFLKRLPTERMREEAFASIPFHSFSPGELLQTHKRISMPINFSPCVELFQ